MVDTQAAAATIPRFFLGGADLEMVEIENLLQRFAPGHIEDKHLAWGAKLSAYRDELLAALRAGETPVVIELADDLPSDLFDRVRILVIDHHGERAGFDRPTSIEQIFQFLHIPILNWSRWLALVAANDRAHVAGLRAAGASQEEIAKIRAADRKAQGIGAVDEVEAQRAIAARHRKGRLTVIDTTTNTSSAIADLISPDLGGPGYERLLVVMPDKVAVYGDGETIRDLGESYPDSWWGGNLPTAGYWGMVLPSAQRPELAALVERLS